MQVDRSLGPSRYLLALLAVLSLALLVSAAPAFAQDQYDCASFGSQESAQAELDRDPSDPSNLDEDDDGQACEDYDYGTSGTSPQGADSGGDASRDLDCSDFATQVEAQAEYDADPSDPHGLDANDDGQACEEVFGSDAGAADGQYADRKDDVIPGTFKKRPLPGTGGPPLLLLPWLLVLTGAGISVLRRR